ncbi:hypothetical protein A2819_03065 [Candidatus Azambacteria bacterium RIFCSPHIGHO2_01_FULL_40_24]|uniref:Uncharacterized protein n=1 Tax=Candidatus Azambacteria bacterium RIFCSPHIGHO2_01_FULL_40_24 TaxID=1797301 RepID=A0A1F5B276_9BACT|nr:MAG: hypothetical protein A2819_03065 [Candidatus Azambacteria bacterium RIFCSPHIGHO2_01_FULL_40_24]
MTDESQYRGRRSAWQQKGNETFQLISQSGDAYVALPPKFLKRFENFGGVKIPKLKIIQTLWPRKTKSPHFLRVFGFY